LKSLDLGGTTKTCQLFARYLAEHTDHEPFLLFKNGSDTARLHLFEEFLDSHHWIPFNDEADGDRIIAELDPDILHVYRSGQPEWPYPGGRAKFVETNVFGFYNPDMGISKSLYMSKWLHDAVKRELSPISRGIPRWGTRFDFINNPILPPSHDERPYLPGHDKGAIWLGRCGRPDDGIYDDINIKASWLLRARGYDVRFLVMAPPPRMLQDLEQYQIPYRVVDTSVDEDALSYFYNAIDIYAHARADGETFGNNIAEAMYHGKPVVTHAAVPSHPGMGVFQSQTTLVTHDENGFVVSHSIPEYARALETLILNEDRRLAMGEAARNEAHQRFDWRVSGHKLVSIYEELLCDED